MPSTSTGKKAELRIEELKRRRTLLYNDARHPEKLDDEIKRLEKRIGEYEEALDGFRIRLAACIERRDCDRPAELEAIDNELRELRSLFKNAEACVIADKILKLMRSIDD